MDGKRYILKYDFGGLRPGTEPYHDVLNAVLEDYLERVHAIRMSLLDLPSDMRNWEQIEARRVDASFSESIDDSIGDDPSSSVMKRAILVTGRERHVMRIVDLVLT